ncbi:hypothetical protein Slin15195_G069970 [Septoria linicola]|uniref:F-box domain-containing protein n=1 Tax=Septoria linicola TaxID=215465 RepID=A0A9Q9AUY9_9PEZI|nr:hypothetical protein Slin15195_G069970 [Septoria linicola]
MAHLQRDMDNCLAAIDSQNEAILQHSQAIAKLMSEVQRLHGIRDATATEDRSDSKTSNETTSAVLKSSAGVLGASLSKPNEADSNMVMTAARQFPSFPSLPVEDSAVAYTLPAGAVTSKATPKEEPKLIQPIARESAAARELVLLQTQMQAPVPAFAFPPLPASAFCPSLLLIKPFEQMSLANCAKVEPEKSDLVLRIPRQKTFRLLSLPRELRDRIYEYALAPGKALLRSKSARARAQGTQLANDCETVTSALFQVNRQVSREAREIFFKKNMILLDADEATELFMLGIHGAIRYTTSIAQHAWAFLTTASISFDIRSFQTEDGLSRVGGWLHSTTGPVPAGRHSPGFLAHLAHDYIYSSWRGLLRRVLKFKSLRFLRLDVTYCYCSTGCCRTLKEVAENLDAYCSPRIPEVIEIVGTKTLRERDMFIRALLEPRIRPILVSEQESSEALAEHTENAMGTELRFKDPYTVEPRLKKLYEAQRDIGLCDEVVEVRQDYCLGKKRKSGNGGAYGGLSIRPRALFRSQFAA